MAPRLQLEKAAWRWAESVRPEEVTLEHIETAYRVLLEPCVRGLCRRNCKGNPNCLVGVGEHVWLGEIDESSFHNIDDPNCERRKKNTFVGLTNLGATCYVNTFVQVWFLNMELRRALYLYEDASSMQRVEKCVQEDKEYEPQTICEHLQYLFALLHNSNRRYIDPSGFIRALGLDTGQQQDAQEFSKLFMSLLEEKLSGQKDPYVRDIIQRQFCGQYAYVTVCSRCGRESRLLSMFYELELNIQGHKQLTDCVTEFLKEERLEGDNRYFCEGCQSKQNATRRIRLLRLPPTLNLQLMRFVFDRQTGHKKKLNTYIGFGETLEMDPFMDETVFLQKLVELDNCKFEEWCVEMSEMRKESVDKGKAKHEEVKELYQRLPAGADKAYDFIPLEWLQKWLDESTPSKPIDNSKYLCPHGRLHPDKISLMKRISEYAAEVFYKRYHGGPRLKADSLCKDCVVERCRVLRLKNQLNEDHKSIANMVKVTMSSKEGFWIGKASLRRWRQLATEQLGHHQEDECEHGDVKMNGSAPKREELLEDKREEDADTGFNEDLVCQHGGLCMSESERRLVSEATWVKLKEYFPTAPEFRHDQEPCLQCQVLEQEGERNDALHKKMAYEQKLALPNLFQDKSRPCGGSWPQETSELYIVSQFFVEEWRKFIRRPTKCGPVQSLGNKLLLCPHGGLMFSFSTMTKEDSKLFALLWPAEWEVIQKLFIVDHTIRISRTVEDAAALYVSEPELCPECREGLLCQQERDLREYAQATIYVHKVVDSKKVVKEAAPELNVSSSDPEEEKEEPRPEGENDPDFNQANGAVKRQKVSIQGQAAYPKQPGIRRSTRHRKVRGEKALLVSANQTLKDLKIQIMHAFSVAPFDQNLLLDGKILSEDAATLGSLGIVPESVILLKADEPIAEYAAMDDVMQVCLPEEGFKGTGLLGH
ncbi:ubiquitin carboxyl-terminal hydrolase 48 isoform X3 [Ranitomeya variabilis]|uniref:ubiquitin carboxyl-terminal hydrolase 48 isoform X3 n=1 Tax=Ranitomeya variabilis TaxID=490064 RepID=UPI0040577EB5